MTALDAATGAAAAPRPADWWPARLWLIALAVLLAGYQLSGRGFAHLAVGPIYLGEIVLGLGVVAVGATAIRFRRLPGRSPVLFLLVAYMALGVVDTVPYLATYGKDALRDAVLWGYGTFALLIVVLLDRALVERVLRTYGRWLPVFALWLPICWQLWQGASAAIDPQRPGDVVPLVFFKAGDMAVQSAGAFAFLVLVASPPTARFGAAWRAIAVAPLLWTDYVAAAISRGSMLTSFAAIVGTVVTGPRSRNWRAVALGLVLLVTVLVPQDLGSLLDCGSSVSAADGLPSLQGRAVNPCQVFVNTTSIVTTTGIATSPSGGDAASGEALTLTERNLAGTMNFRLTWWAAIIDYTFEGPYFWTGKGFGINLADADGFQPTEDHSLRAPHNSHMTALARMGVPGFTLWVFLQVAFGLGLLRSILRFRRAGDRLLAGTAAWLAVFWAAMMVNASFDPYLEGPQGGIWFWVVFGVGMGVMRLAPVRNDGLGPIGLPLDPPWGRRPAPAADRTVPLEPAPGRAS